LESLEPPSVTETAVAVDEGPAQEKDEVVVPFSWKIPPIPYAGALDVLFVELLVALLVELRREDEEVKAGFDEVDGA
jgi:hypothetical protein